MNTFNMKQNMDPKEVCNRPHFMTTVQIYKILLVLFRRLLERRGGGTFGTNLYESITGVGKRHPCSLV